MRGGSKAELSSLLSQVKLRSLAGEYYRCVPESAAGFVLEDGPSYRSQNRFNVADQFGALYLADDPEVCRATLEKRGLLPDRRQPHVLVSFEIECGRILDLTDPHSWGRLNLSIEDFMKPSDIPDAYSLPQKFASTVYLQGKIAGLLVPDATHTGNTLVVYPARLLSNHFIKAKSTSSL